MRLSALLIVPAVAASWLPSLAYTRTAPQPLLTRQSHCLADDGEERAEEIAIFRTRQWIEHAVVRLRLCPFASKPLAQDQIRYAVSKAEDDASLVEDFFAESLLLLNEPVDALATTMLIAPRYQGGCCVWMRLWV